MSRGDKKREVTDVMDRLACSRREAGALVHHLGYARVSDAIDAGVAIETLRGWMGDLQSARATSEAK